MKTKSILSFFLLLTTPLFAQDIQFVKDEIMSNYMKSGYANKNFAPNGETDKNNLRQGFWKDYEVSKDYAYVSTDNQSKQVFGHFLLYGEGKYLDGNRVGKWLFYTIEDKTFKKNIQKEINYAKGERQGEFKYFFPNGNLSEIGNYENGKFEGIVKSYYSDGKIHGTRLYKNDLKTGHHIYLYPNGKTELDHNFVNGTKDGLYQAFYPNGNLQEKFYYKMGKEDGVYQYYYENGQLWVEKTFDNGLLVNVKGNYTKEGKSRDKGSVKNGNGTVIHYTEEGKIYLIVTFKDGLKISEENF